MTPNAPDPVPPAPGPVLDETSPIVPPEPVEAVGADERAGGDQYAERILREGWTQGSVIGPEDLPRLVPDLPPIEAEAGGAGEPWFGVVVSQACDIVDGDFLEEPHVEVLICRVIPRSDGNYRDARHPRRLQCDIGRDGAEVVCETRLVNRRWLPRMALASFPPAHGYELPRRTLRAIREWLMRRYDRPAFPDEFNRRRSARRRQIERLLTKLGDRVEGIFVQLDDPEEELPEAVDYHVRVIVVARAPGELSAATQSPEWKASVRNDILAPFCEELNACPGIRVVSHQVLGTHEFTIEHQRYYQRYDADYVTIAQQEGGDASPIIRTTPSP